MTGTTPSRRTVLGVLGAVPLAATGVFGGTAHASAPALEARIRAIVHRPAFARSRWGMAFHAPDTGEVLYAMSPDELFVAASAFKVFIAGTAFEALGPDHRFRTRAHRTGPVVRGVLRGDLVLVAGGDLLLSGRTRPDGTPAVPEPDPTYPGGTALPDPLREIRDLARQVAAGVRHVEGRVVVDTSLFREAREGIALGGAEITVSPMMVNDHVVHAVVTPGATAGAPAVVRAAPDTGYVRFTSQVTTVPAAGPVRPLKVTDDVTHPDGTHTATVTGDVALGGPPRHVAYFVPSPSLFAATVFAEALREHGVRVRGGVSAEAAPEWRGAPLAEHVSVPLAEEVKVMLKASSNVHTVTFPYLVGAIAGRDPVTSKATYQRYRRELFRAAGLDPDPVGAADGKYTARTFTKFLAHMKERPHFDRYHRALPIMGRDGTIGGNQPTSPAAGHVYAKTGTGVMSAPNGGASVHKALAGYIELPNGRWLTFAQFMAQETASGTGHGLAGQAQEAMAEIATAVYETFARSPR
ncbi:D-alanyl-D-alanine carboxypeptidase/D-alanyl-D-alanine endopeptidase [Saccharothrix luteola]|uniref:D-alanyl-D-alanine carboxypeptidase/D-alanyl-D-alanine endopeptidase n=1 Tax=Saccharothrix luteola TaxID=2893018 RepID=UPI001E505FAC|nr:D-alanyl-D-alanine carboxypeptidase/D-alanyl-D-alanine-endopeptidase [Saccharothrix luteola]MCC8250404.1 D-alanyl-D-alanine carboxypeptidase/D-alanyl-D-alanine-endopeptidase [Saccharothrix luteola]